ncbi:MAG: hypothetical protein Q4C34_08985 [Bacteroidales bacterium]|nr:hypothetical protein [Bacteroidales bacterium]
MTGPQLAGMVSGVVMLLVLIVAGTMCRRDSVAVVVPPVSARQISQADTVPVREHDDSVSRKKSRRRTAKRKAPLTIRPEARNYLDEAVTRPAVPDTLVR